MNGGLTVTRKLRPGDRLRIDPWEAFIEVIDAEKTSFPENTSEFHHHNTPPQM
jgi:hypothetical protein